MHEESETSLGDVIREVRKKQGWSQGELGEKAGVSRPTIARVEANNDVTTATIAKVARALGLKLELRDDD
ncbi:helix-turn-helix transcriptional regulator [Streptomyces pseudogriseolus]|uniref:helix-turn-helix transcriptional regulator n=1 Tax=Streptomyces pseudogriseolus TaxID=36817 RepID=UPI003FA1F087